MFSFIQLVDTISNQPVPMDFQAFRIIGFDEVYANTYISDDDGITPKQRTPTEFNHWLYGPCNNDSDTRGISYLINFKHFEESACIRKYYDKNKGQYFDTNSPNFRWPIILKGCSNPKRTFYGIIMEKCREDDAHILSGYDHCKTDAEINNIINKNSVIMQLMDQYADALNYEMPFEKYFYAVTTALTPENFAVNHLNFNPSIMVTHNGFFFDNIVNEPSYIFTQNEKQILITDVSSNVNIYGCLLGFYFWMQNSLQYYERNYKRIQDILSDIGGINSIIISFSGLINFFVQGYIILLDTQDLILTTDKKNFDDKNERRRPSIFKKVPDKLFPPKRLYYNNVYRNENQPSFSNYQRLMKDGVDIYPNLYSRDEKAEQYKNLYMRRNNNNNYEQSKDGTYCQESQQGYNNRGNGYNSGRGVQNYNRGNYRQGGYYEKKDSYMRNFKDDATTEKREEDFDIDNRPLEKQQFNWFKYIYYLICCGRTDKRVTYYEDFRAKLISEENIVQNYLDIYKLLKACNLKKTVFHDKQKENKDD